MSDERIVWTPPPGFMPYWAIVLHQTAVSFALPPGTTYWACLDCGADTYDEYFMVHNEVWNEAVGEPGGKLCVPCLEARLGRELTGVDFTECPANDLAWRKTERLRERMTT